MKAYRITGTFLMGPSWQRFRKEVAAPDPDAALERLYSDLGSKHGTRRGRIRVRRVEEIEVETVTDPVVAYLVGGGSA